MSDQNEPVERPKSTPETETDRLEGSYTERDGEAPHVRTVAGRYTRTDGAPDDEEDVVGDYVETLDGPITHDASERHGKFIRTDRDPTKR
ncbi:hypothetical protein [Agromyces sp. Marseille-P2726]|uniref:hypothetical protein n=1 Tax=Agromyces sp. Marseille-P2726 TaxID=2709132 RepID=UPI00156F354A|nr:hypothetical protein [Agromyces sp. Marseille-P2726]